MTLVRLEPVAPRSRVKHITTEPLRSLQMNEQTTKVHVVTDGKRVNSLLSAHNFCKQFGPRSGPAEH